MNCAKLKLNLVAFLASMLIASAPVFAGQDKHHDADDAGSHREHEAIGPHGGRLLIDGDAQVELAIFEQATPAEYRAWITHQGQLITEHPASLIVTLTRLGGKQEKFYFTATGDYWLGSAVVEEPHSFDVAVTLEIQGNIHQWNYGSHEGRISIRPDIAAESGIKTSIAASGTIRQTQRLYGNTVMDPNQISHIRARFPGTVTDVLVNIGDNVQKGQVLAVIESNESLKRYKIRSPLSGVITARHANPGELAHEQELFIVANYDQLWAELRAFPEQMRQIAIGQVVTLSAMDRAVSSEIKHFLPNQANHPFMLARVPINNGKVDWTPGIWVEAEVVISEKTAPLVVDNRALQSFREWTVVFVQVGDQYEIRPLTLGRQDSQFTEVLAGLNQGDTYVVENSYLIKADIEKSGASHDH